MSERKFSNALMNEWGRWFTQRVMLRTPPNKIGIVAGVCDDGAQCDHDARRKWKPTGELIIQWEDGTTSYVLASSIVRIIDGKLSPGNHAGEEQESK